MRLLRTATLRQAQRHPAQVALAILGVMLGVAVVTAIDITRTSANAAFLQATEVINGRATHHIEAGPSGLPETLYPQLRRRFPTLAMAPVVTGKLRTSEGLALTLLGIDPIAEGPFRAAWRGDPRSGLPIGLAMSDFITHPDGLIATLAAARSLQAKAGDYLRFETEHGPQMLQLLAVLTAETSSPALAETELLFADIATAQVLLRELGQLTRIEIRAERELPPTLIAALPSTVTLTTVEQSTQSKLALTEAFHINLQALSLLALLVGMFLVYNAQSFMVVQRRTEWGTLRALGLSRAELLLLLLMEAALIGAVGTLGGLLIGIVLAHALIALVAQTINDLYFSLAITQLSTQPATVLKVILLGVGGAMLAALVPALEAASGPPRSAFSRTQLEGMSRRLAWQFATLGCALMSLGVVLLTLPDGDLGIGFVGLFALVLGLALVNPLAAVGIIEALPALPALRHSVVLRLGSRGVTAALSRTGLAITALSIAIATTMGIGVMVGSFRHAVADWLGTALQADFYLNAGGSNLTLARGLVAELTAYPGIRELSHVRRVDLPGPEGRTALAAYALTPNARAGFKLQTVVAEDFWTAFENGAVVMVSEPYAYHHRLEAGDQLRLPTTLGEKTLTVGAVFRDYSSDRGFIAMSRQAYDHYWPGDDRINGIGLYVGPSFDPESLEATLAARHQQAPPILITDGLAIQRASLAVFDRTFTITEVLRLLAGAIAFVGVLSALLAIELERARELAVLRALGLSDSELFGMVLTATAIIGVTAGLLAIPTGLAMAIALTEVINQRAFGWTMALHIEASQIVGALLLAILAALLAGIYPARRIIRTAPAAILRGE